MVNQRSFAEDSNRSLRVQRVRASRTASERASTVSGTTRWGCSGVQTNSIVPDGSLRMASAREAMESQGVRWFFASAQPKPSGALGKTSGRSQMGDSGDGDSAAMVAPP